MKVIYIKFFSMLIIAAFSLYLASDAKISEMSNTDSFIDLSAEEDFVSQISSDIDFDKSQYESDTESAESENFDEISDASHHESFDDSSTESIEESSNESKYESFDEISDENFQPSEESSIEESNEISEAPSNESIDEPSDEPSQESSEEVSEETSDFNHTEHIFKSWVVIQEPTCQKEGLKERKCNICEHAETISIEVLPHNEKIIEGILPTCTEKGMTQGKKCSICNQILVAPKEIPEKGHVYTSETILPTCQSEGYTMHKCFCGNSYKDNKIAKTSHDYNKTVILPTLKDQGYTKYLCKNCQNAYNSDYTTYDIICKNAYSENSQVLAQGIDVSKWNHRTDSNGNYLPLDWKQIKKSGIDFVILKAGSTKGKDPTFEMNYKDAKEAGLQIGAYYYVYAMNSEEATKDANDFIEMIKGKQFEYPVYMDFEDSSQRYIDAKIKTEMIINFVSTLQRAGYYSGLYTGYYWMNTRFGILESEKLIDMLDIWFAHIDSAESVNIETKYKWNPDDNLGYSEFGMWQYAHKGVFSFISNEFFDLNYAYKDYPSIIKKLGLNGFSKTDYKKEYVTVLVKNLNVRSYWDTSTSDNILGIIHKGDKYEIIEKTSAYIKISYNGQMAYISADPEHVSVS